MLTKKFSEAICSDKICYRINNLQKPKSKTNPNLPKLRFHLLPPLKN
jgi:hypothetical protein